LYQNAIKLHIKPEIAIRETNNQARIAAMLTYFNAVLSGEAEPFWPHVILLSVSIMAAFAVGFGILLESPKYSAAVHRIATWLVLGGIAVESLCTVFLFVFDESISSKQQSTIESQNSQIIALETRLAPRHLSDDHKDKLVDRMSVFAGTKFAISSASSAEAETFAIEIADVLVLAKWQWISWPLGGIATNPPKGRPQIGLDLMTGIEAHIFDQAKAPIATELFRGLADAGFKSQWVLMPTNPNATDMLIIIIGSKE
jgi:hypothetical protein